MDLGAIFSTERIRRLTAVDESERRLAGAHAGTLFITGGVTLTVLPLIQGVHGYKADVLFALGAATAVSGGVFLWAIDWRRAPLKLVHGVAAAAFAMIALSVWASGGTRSPATGVYLIFMVVFAAYYFPPAAATVYVLVACLVQTLPVLYSPGGLSSSFASRLAIVIPGFLLLGLGVGTGKRQLVRLRRQAEHLAGEQAALRRVATAVAEMESPASIYALAAKELARLVGASGAGILRLEDDGGVAVMGAWGDRPKSALEPGARVPLRPGSGLANAIHTGHPTRVDHHPSGSLIRRLGYSSSITAPVDVNGEPWGALVVAGFGPEALGPGVEQQLSAFGGLLATAISNIETRSKLERQASTDPLTGLVNHRVLHERLASEAARAARHGRPLSLAMVDLDNFKEVNDLAGHETGDRVLARVAGCLRSLARAEDVLGRIGGDEIAWVLPEVDRMQALAALERARVRLAADRTLAPVPITISAGICDMEATQDPEELMKLADSALYWGKAHGRNVCWVYDHDVSRTLTAQERVRRLERSNALLGLRALARGIDGKDPATARHSERVSELAVRLAGASGWNQEQAQLLGEAALVHDVGKLGVSERLLAMDRSLTAPEYEEVKTHAELSARIIEEVLSPEQVAWVRAHHERPDGSGYPRGLYEAEIPEGAALLGLADAWDAMTVARPAGQRKSTTGALAECRLLAGRQFTAGAVAALERVHASGDLETVAERRSSGSESVSASD